MMHNMPTVDNGELVFGAPSGDTGHVLAFRKKALLSSKVSHTRHRTSGSKLGEQRLWFATIAPLRNANGLYDPSKGYLVTFGSFEDAVQRDTLEEAKLHVLAIYALTG